MRWQLTLFGPPERHPVSHPDDRIVTEDGISCLRKQAIKTDDGYFHNSENVMECKYCDTKIAYDNDREDCCETCFEQNYTTCDHCGDTYHNEDVVHSESGDAYCRDCYLDLFITCDCCGEEIYRDDSPDGYHCDSCYCEDEPEIEVPYRWRGSDKHTEIASLRKFGVELETSGCDDYANWLETSAFGATTDGSISGMEFVSAPLYGDDGLAAIRRFCDSARYCEVDSSCGFHLHVDLSDTTKEQRKAIAYAYYLTERFWHRCVDSSREDYRYCRKIRKQEQEYIDSDDFVHCGYDGRYSWVNWMAYSKHKTVEIRLHHGTLDADEITYWIRLHVAFIEYVKDKSVAELAARFKQNPDFRLDNVAA